MTQLLNERAEISFVSSSAGLVWDCVRLKELSARFRCVASAFAEQAQSPRTVFLAVRNSPDLLICVWACLSAGLPFCIVSPDKAEPFFRGCQEPWFPKDLLPAVLVCERQRCHGLEQYCPRVYASDELADVASRYPPIEFRSSDPADVAYFQLTSGSSGKPKAVPVTHGMLSTNIEQISKRCELNNSDRTVLWIPLCHDMGLVTFLMSVSLGGGTLMMDTQCFVRDPMSWLKYASDFRATTSAVPNFALRVTARLARARRGELNLETIRRIWIGGEPVFPATMAAFAATFASSGLKPDVLRPAYGLAEAVVGVSTSMPSESVRTLRAEISSLALGGKVSLATDSSKTGISYTSNGKPLPAIDLEIWSEEGNSPLPELHLGRIMLRGPTVCAAYAGKPSDLEYGWRDTGDIGFVHDNELFIVGRRQGIIIRGGVNFAVEDVEDAVHSVLDGAVRRVAAFSRINHRVGMEQIIILCESRKPQHSVREIVSTALVEILGISPDFVLTVPPGTIPLTSSGKIRRHELRERYAEYDFSEDGI